MGATLTTPPCAYLWGLPGKATLASSLDVAPTVLGLVGLPRPDSFEGHDFSPTLLDNAEPPADRTTYHQAHKGVTKGRSPDVRQKGLLEVALVQGGQKEMLRIKSGTRQIFDLVGDPYETLDQSATPQISPQLDDWLRHVREGLIDADLLPTTPLDEESMDKMRALGYVE